SVSFYHPHFDQSANFQADYWAHRLLQQDVKLHMEKYTGLPHVFPSMLPHHPASPRSFNAMGAFIQAHANDRQFDYKRISLHQKTLKESPHDEELLSLGALTLEEVKELQQRELKKWKRHQRVEEGKAVSAGEGEGAAAAAGAAAKL